MAHNSLQAHSLSTVTISLSVLTSHFHSPVMAQSTMTSIIHTQNKITNIRKTGFKHDYAQYAVTKRHQIQD